MSVEKRHLCQSADPRSKPRRFRAPIVAVVTIALVAMSASALAEIPEKTGEPEAVLTYLGGWRVFARRVSSEGTRLTLHQVKATLQSDPRWSFAARRLEVMPALTGPSRVAWMWAEGPIRLAGPHDLYVMGTRAVSLQPQLRLAVLADDSRPKVVGSGWTLPADAVQIDLSRSSVELAQVGGR